MQTIPEFEITFYRRGAAYGLEARFQHPASAVDSRAQSPDEFVLDLEALSALIANGEIDEYAQTISSAVFSHPAIRDLFLQALDSSRPEPLRFRLVVDARAAELQSVHWELLQNPRDGSILTADENLLFSRYLAEAGQGLVRLRPRENIRALAIVSRPNDLESYNLPAFDPQDALEHALAGLAGIQVETLVSGRDKCTLSNILQELRKGYDFVYLVAHGTLANGKPFVWLEEPDGSSRRVPGGELAGQLRSLRQPPLLVVLASCESAGTAAAARNPALQALGPLLSQAGVPAVLAMQGRISVKSVDRMMPVLFQELLRDGDVDRALAAARGILLVEKAPDFWMPVLFSRLRDGRIWQEQASESAERSFRELLGGFRLRQWIGIGLVLLAVAAASFFVVAQLKPKAPPVMTGEFRIAIARFAEQGAALPEQIGYTVAESIHSRLAADLAEISVGPKVEIWSTDRIGTIEGETAQARAQKAAQLAQDLHAYLVIYGVVRGTENGVTITPEFYLDTPGFYEGAEITGQYGGSLPLPLANSSRWAYEFDRKMKTEADVISSFSQGLSFLAVQDYAGALKIFQDIDRIQEWEDQEGKKALYALTGFAAGKQGDFDLTEQMLKKSLAIDPEYARPYVGLANLAYMRALQPMQQSGKPGDVDFSLLQACDDYLEAARKAANKPPLAEVDAKIHFAQGQCSLMKTYSGHDTSFDRAAGEFEQVIAVYDDGADLRVQELAGESYARLGLIRQLSGQSAAAGRDYQKAADVLRLISPERAGLYQKRADTLLGITPTP